MISYTVKENHIASAVMEIHRYTQTDKQIQIMLFLYKDYNFIIKRILKYEEFKLVLKLANMKLSQYDINTLYYIKPLSCYVIYVCI